jgi:hypothetical protein
MGVLFLEYELDLSRIEDHILKPNYLLMLGFPEGWIPLRVLTTDPLQYYLYDPINEGAISGPVPAATTTNGITNLGWQPAVLFGSVNITGSPQNVLRVINSDELYQVFFGVKPSYARIYREMPKGTAQGNIDLQNWTQSYNQFGWIDGRESPFNSPSPRSETIIPPEFDIGWAIANPTPEPISPLFNFVLNRVRIGVILDPDLVEKIIERKVYVEYYYVGGLSGYRYSLKKYYSIEPLQLNMTKSEIAKALGV